MKNISNKERTINYIKAQIARLSEMINENKEHYPNCPERSSHLYSGRNALYKELRQTTAKRKYTRKTK